MSASISLAVDSFDVDYTDWIDGLRNEIGARPDEVWIRKRQ